MRKPENVKMSFSMQNVLDGIAQDKNVNKLDSSLKKTTYVARILFTNCYKCVRTNIKWSLRNQNERNR